ncbi:MAG: zf-HC2 domain-containing protein [Firmicutes bacterium]|nr:zf-HC2 domain-containing protein [Bacillota bacterium]
MNCREISSRLSLYLDQELDDLDHKRVEKHIQSCPACSRELDTLAKTVRVIKAAAGRGPDDHKEGWEWITRKR